MPSRKIEEQLETLASLRRAAPDEVVLATLKKALANRVNIVVAKAAAITAELRIPTLIPELLKAFERLFENAAATDPQCWGKNALSKALKYLGHDESAIFIRGLQHVQMEPVWGTVADTAGTLRGTCVLALLQCSDITREDKVWHGMRALTDQQASVRADAARTLQGLSGLEAALLLRLKARMGDRESAVTGQVFDSLLDVEQDAAVPFVAEFLDDRDSEIQEEAALSLGASRLPAGVSALIEAWNGDKNLHWREALLRGLSASRQETAIDFLLELIRNGRERDALAALQALQLHRDSPEIHRQIGEAVERRGEPSIQDQFRRRAAPR